MSDTLAELLTDPVSGLDYRIRPPQAGQGAAPCLLLLHGVGANESGFVEMARRLDPRLAVILVRGPLVFAPGRFGWFQVKFTPTGPAIDPAQAEESRLKLLQFIGRLPALHGADPQKTWIAGFSQGGIMSAGVGLTAPGSVAGFGLLSGRILPEILPLLDRGDPRLRRLQAFVSHGVDDQTLGIHFAHMAKALLEELGVPLEYREYAAGHALDGDMVGDFQRWLGVRIG